MTNHRARKELANQKWIHRSVYPCGISEQALGAVAQTDSTGDLVTRPAATQAKKHLMIKNCDKPHLKSILIFKKAKS